MALAEWTPGSRQPDLAVVTVENLRHAELVLENPVELIYFGGSPKRETLLKHVAEETGLAFRCLPGGPEDNDSTSAEIAAGKIKYGLHEELPRVIRSSKKTRVAIAGDVTLLTQTVRRDGSISWDRIGKPDHPKADFQQVLQNMIRTVEITGDPSYFSYSIDSASESRLIQGLDVKGKPKAKARFINVALKEEAVRYFATDQGAQEYLDTSRRLLASPLYRNGLVDRRGSSPAESCAAFEIAVWEMYKAISGIGREKRTGRRFKQKLRTAFRATYDGIDPEVVTQVHPDAPHLVAEWSWPDQIMDASRAA